MAGYSALTRIIVVQLHGRLPMLGSVRVTRQTLNLKIAGSSPAPVANCLTFIRISDMIEETALGRRQTLVDVHVTVETLSYTDEWDMDVDEKFRFDADHGILVPVTNDYIKFYPYANVLCLTLDIHRESSEQVQ